MPDPLDPTPPDEIAPPSREPEVDPGGLPGEQPAPQEIPDDGMGRPIDGSALGAVGETI